MNVKTLLLYEQRSAKVFLWDFTTDIQNCNTYQSLKQIASPMKTNCFNKVFYTYTIGYL